MTSAHTNYLKLTHLQQERLRRMAAQFDVAVGGSPEAGMDLLSPSMPDVMHFDDWERGHLRLLAEVCAQTLRWIPFSLSESCHETLFRRSDAQLARVGELYCAWRDRILEEWRAAHEDD